MSDRKHNLTVWARDVRRNQWAWSCSCGTRFQADLPDIDAARREARTHASQRALTLVDTP